MTRTGWKLPTGRPPRDESRERLVVVHGKIPESLKARLLAVMEQRGITTESEAVRIAIAEMVSRYEQENPGDQEEG